MRIAPDLRPGNYPRPRVAHKLPAGLAALPATTTAAFATETAAATWAAAATTLALGPGFIDVESPAAQIGAVQRSNGPIRLGRIGHFYESEAPRTTRVTVSH